MPRAQTTQLSLGPAVCPKWLGLLVVVEVGVKVVVVVGVNGVVLVVEG
jgi:hypothetical protein